MNLLETSNQIIIYVKKDGSEIAEKYDRDDVCMKASIASFEILLSNPQGSDFDCGKEPQIVLHLRNFKGPIKYATEDGTSIDYTGDQEADVVACAVESVLRLLHEGQCVGKNVISFQSRRGKQLSGLRFIVLNPNSPHHSLNFKAGIISRTYAYLDERKLCLFLNDKSSDTLGKIGGILTKLFTRYESPKMI